MKCIRVTHRGSTEASGRKSGIGEDKRQQLEMARLAARRSHFNLVLLVMLR